MIFTRTVFIYRRIRLAHFLSFSFDTIEFINLKQNLQSKNLHFVSDESPFVFWRNQYWPVRSSIFLLLRIDSVLSLWLWPMLMILLLLFVIIFLFFLIWSVQNQHPFFFFGQICSSYSDRCIHTNNEERKSTARLFENTKSRSIYSDNRCESLLDNSYYWEGYFPNNSLNTSMRHLIKLNVEMIYMYMPSFLIRKYFSFVANVLTSLGNISTKMKSKWLMSIFISRHVWCELCFLRYLFLANVGLLINNLSKKSQHMLSQEHQRVEQRRHFCCCFLYRYLSHIVSEEIFRKTINWKRERE